MNVDLSQLKGDVEGIKALLDEIKTMKWLDGHGVLPEGCLLFETRDEALDAAYEDAYENAYNADGDCVYKDAIDAAIEAAHNAAYGAACHASWYVARDDTDGAVLDAIAGVAYKTAYDAVVKAIHKIAYLEALDARRDATHDVALYASVLTCDGLPLAQKHVDHAKMRWSAWQNGYGVVCDVTDKDGKVTLYCYRKP